MCNWRKCILRVFKGFSRVFLNSLLVRPVYLFYQFVVVFSREKRLVDSYILLHSATLCHTVFGVSFRSVRPEKQNAICVVIV